MHTPAPSSRASGPPGPASGEHGIVVGFDGSRNAEKALGYGAAIAARRGAPLTVIHSYRPTIPGYPTIEGQPLDPEDVARREQAEAVFESAATLLSDHPGPVSYRAIEGDSVGALVDASETADLMVVGARGRGGFLGRVLGSVSTALPAYAHCPTVVVPVDAEPGNGPVVVGVDGSPHARRAALCAAREAVDREVPLLMVTAMQTPDSGGFWVPMLHGYAGDALERHRRELHEALQEELARVQEEVPGVEATGEVRTGSPAVILHEAGPEAQLVVVGTHGRGRFASALIGSVSRATLHGARRPVMVVPTRAADEGRAG